jgi:hypothetical protein
VKAVSTLELCGDVPMGSEKSSYTRVITIVDKTGIKVLCIMLGLSHSAYWEGFVPKWKRAPGRAQHTP